MTGILDFRFYILDFRLNKAEILAVSSPPLKKGGLGGIDRILLLAVDL